MTTRHSILISSARRRLRAFGRDEEGVAAMEAAFVFPLMVVILGLVVIWGQGYDIKRKVTQTAQQVTDLVASYPLGSGAMPQATLDGYLDYASLTMLPYTEGGYTTPLAVVVTEYQADATGKVGTALWSEPVYQGVAHALNSTITLPTGLVAPNGYVILGEVSWSYSPLNVGPFPVSTMTLYDSIFLAPRSYTCVPTWSYHPGTCT